MKTYDIVLIGTGQATGKILPELLNMNLNIGIVEADKTGGTCVNWGCTPTKTLVASARAAHMARRGRDFGVEITDFSINFGKVMERVNRKEDSSWPIRKLSLKTFVKCMAT